MSFVPPRILTNSEANVIRGKCLMGHASPSEQMQLIGHFDLVEMELRGALETLVNRLDAVHADPRYQSVWTLFMLHGGDYRDPKYEDELNAARAALEKNS